MTAPDLDIFSTYSDGTYTDTLLGTSMAITHVSGLASFIWSMEANLHPDQVTHPITSTADGIHELG